MRVLSDRLANWTWNLPISIVLVSVDLETRQTHKQMPAIFVHHRRFSIVTNFALFRIETFVGVLGNLFRALTRCYCDACCFTLFIQLCCWFFLLSFLIVPFGAINSVYLPICIRTEITLPSCWLCPFISPPLLFCLRVGLRPLGRT